MSHIVFSRRLIAGLLGAALFVIPACSDEPSERVSSATPVDEQTPPPTTLPYAQSDLRAEAVPLINLANRVDQLVVELYANEYVKEASLVTRQVARAKSLRPSLATCLSSAGLVPAADATLLASALIDSRFALRKTNGDVVEIYPEEGAAVRARSDLDPDASSIEGSVCIDPVDAATAFVFGGDIATRADEMRNAGTWVVPAGSEQGLIQALTSFCPSVVDGTSQVCSNMAGYLGAVIDLHRSTVQSNLEGLDE